VTYLRKLHPQVKSSHKKRWKRKSVGRLTVENSGYPVNDGTPEVDPADEVEIVRRIGLALKDVKYSFIEKGNGT
jgi:hypothetical protein